MPLDRRSLGYLLGLFVVPAIFFVSVWIQGQVFGAFDLGHITIAIEDVFARYQRAGQVPVWAPEFHGGFPLMANAFQSFFYAPHVILRQWLPGVWVANISLLLHMCLAGWGMFRWLRWAKFGSATALLGGILFSASGYFVGRVTLPHLFYAAAWIPVVLWTLQRAWAVPSWGRILMASLVVAGQVFAGHIQIVVYTFLAAIILLINEAAGTSAWHWRRKAWLLMVGPAVFLLTAVHTLPSQELVGQSRRAEALTGSEAFDVSYPLRHLRTWIQPDAFGRGTDYHGAKNEPELMTYFGLVGLCLGVLGLVRVRTYRSPIGRAAIGLVVVGLLLALGEFSVVYHWLHDHVWLIARLANPGRAIVLVHVGWVVLAAFGTEWLLRRCRHWERWAGLGLILAVSIELLWWGWGVNPRQNLSVWETPRVAAHVPARQDAPRIFTHTTLELSGRGTFVPEVGPAVTRTSVLQQTIVPQHDEWKGVDVELTWNGQVPTSGQVSLVVLEEDREVRRAAINGEAIDETPIIFSFDPFERAKGRRFTLQLFSSYDLPNAPYIFIRPHYGEGDFNPTGELSVCRLGECNPLTAAGWTRPADAGLHLRYRDRSIWIERELMLPMFGEAAGKFMVRPHLSLQLGTVDAYLRELGLRADYDSSRWVTERDLYDRFSIGTVVAGYPEHRGLVGVPGLTPIARELAGERELAVYRNEQAYPRIEFVQELVPVQDAEMARTALLAGIERHAIVVEGLAEDEIITEVGRSPGRLIVEVDEPTRFHGRVESEGVQFLVMRDVLYSAWKAWIDDQAVSLYRVDGVFRGVLIPAGVHEVRVELISPAWRWGAGLSAGAWVVSLAGLGIIYRNKLRRVSRP